MRSIACMALLVSISVCATETRAEDRMWTDRQGRTIRAEYLGFAEGKVEFRRSDGKVFKVTLDKLSDADQAFVKAQKPPLGISQLLKLIQEAGFGGTNVPILYEAVAAETGAKLSREYHYSCRNQATGAQLNVSRNVVGIFGLVSPGDRFRIVASASQKDQDALLQLAEKVSKSLRGACEEAQTDYQKTRQESGRTIDTFRVVAAQDGLRIESLPPP